MQGIIYKFLRGFLVFCFYERCYTFVRRLIGRSLIRICPTERCTCFVDVSPSIVTIFYMDMDMVFNATFNNISVIYRGLSLLLVEETRVPGGNHRPVQLTDKLCHKILQDGEDS